MRNELNMGRAWRSLQHHRRQDQASHCVRTAGHSLSDSDVCRLPQRDEGRRRQRRQSRERPGLLSFGWLSLCALFGFCGSMLTRCPRGENLRRRAAPGRLVSAVCSPPSGTPSLHARLEGPVPVNQTQNTYLVQIRGDATYS